MFFVMGGLALYSWVYDDPTPRQMIAVGFLLGLATLTRAVFLLFPLGLALHLLLIHRTHARRVVLALLASYAVVISTWTVYNGLVWERVVIGGEGIWGFVYQGATGKASPEELDEGLSLSPGDTHEQRQEAMQDSIEQTLRADPFGWAAHRVRELADAYLQPHNTNRLKGKSFRAAASDWLRHDRSPGGLRDLTQIQSFWPKLALYIFHFGGLILGAAGMWIARRRWRDLLPLYGIIAYFTGIHLVLLALPRYIFPTYPIFWLFAVVCILAAWDRWPHPHRA
jgi:4-amino-4-deoxy-L-arabinose transferase-like glycosyltransferase